MCEYCGCQALSSIGELTREHERVLTLIADARAAGRNADLPRLASLAREIAAMLAPHTHVEEHGLFPALTADFPGQIAQLEAEHRKIESVLGEAADAVPADPAWPGRLEDALAVLRAHIFKEQDGVFPAALATLRAADWDYVEAARARAAAWAGGLSPAPSHGNEPAGTAGQTGLPCTIMGQGRGARRQAARDQGRRAARAGSA